MTKQEKKVNVKAYRTKDGKRVKPFRRRQKVLAGAAVGGSVLGLVAAVKNKKAIGNLIKGAKNKKQPGIQFGKTGSVIPDKFEVSKDNTSIYTRFVERGFSNLDDNNPIDDDVLRKVFSETVEQGSKEAIFTPFIDKAGKSGLSIQIPSALDGRVDKFSRPIDSVVSIKFDKDTNVTPLLNNKDWFYKDYLPKYKDTLTKLDDKSKDPRAAVLSGLPNISIKS